MEILPKNCTFAENFNFMTYKENILTFAREHEMFSIADAQKNIAPDIPIEQMTWYLNQMVKAKTLARVGTGTFTMNTKFDFTDRLENVAVEIYDSLHATLPFARMCIYDSSYISPLQHHLAGNNIIYVEVERNALESVFFMLKDAYKNVYLKPTKETIYQYVDNEVQSIFVKPLISEAPIKMVDSYPIPTIEKLLVDLYKDKDFYMYQGAEYDYIFENALTLYNVNTTKLLRYASRRGIKNEIQNQLKKYDK